MPAPTERSSQSGRPIVFWKRTPSSDWEDVSTEWAAVSCEHSSQSRLSRAVVEFNRSDYISDPTGGEPLLYQDTQFAIVWQEAGQPGGRILFQGVVSNIVRREIGTISAQSSTGSANLIHSVVLFADDRRSQIIGAKIPFIRFPTEAAGEIKEDPTARCVFNPDGKPNRSREWETTTGIFGGNYTPSDTFYFCTPDGYDHDGNLSSPGRVRARYWTYAQAIAYLLTHYAGADGLTTPTVTREVVVKFGTAVGGDDPSLVWELIGQHVDAEPPGEESAPPPDGTLSTNPAKLLTAKVPGIDVTGMNVIDAIGLLLTKCGLGWYIDIDDELPNVDVFVDNPIHKFRVWTPGGELNSGIGEIFLPRLEPHFTEMADRTAASILGSNNVRDADIRFDSLGIVNQPIVKRSPTLYEVTMQLRPLWKPLHADTDGSGAAYFDNCTDDLVTDSQYSGSATQRNVAIGDALLALQAWNNNPEDKNSGDNVSILRRMKFWAKALVSGGSIGNLFYDVGRKWGLPTDWSYPNAEFKRDETIADMPADFTDYTPVNFEYGAFINTGIVGASLWPTRPRPFLPTLSKDRSGAASPPIVEVSFDRGSTWYPFGSVRVSPTESAIWLTYSNPWTDVANPNWIEGGSANMVQAFINNAFRVRVTCSIEGSDPNFIEPAAFGTDELVRSRVINRPQFRKLEILSQFSDNVTPDPDSLADPSTYPIDNPNPEDVLTRLFKPVDDDDALFGEVNSIQVRSAWARVSGNIKIPWIETDARIGMVVPRIDDTANAFPINGATAVPRGLNFEVTATSGERLAPHIAGVVFTFGARNFQTEVVLDDWRTLEGRTDA